MSAPLRFATAAMGTRFELVLLGGTGDLRACGEAAVEEIEEWHRRLNRFASDSLISHINRTAAHEPVRLDRETFELIQDALDVWRASGGAFDITVAPALEALGLAASAEPGRHVGSAGISLDAAAWTIAFRDPGLSIDLGGIAKGHALDRAGALLRSHGVTAALLHGGTSSVLAIGVPPGAEGWAIGVGQGEHARVLHLRDEAVSVSDSQGQSAAGTAAHIVDPRTCGAVFGRGSVAVRGPSARLADAWSTALVVLAHVPDGFPSGYEVL